jgi:ubiquinone/menaquinone biosynthesis C-methylase UbiE
VSEDQPAPELDESLPADVRRYEHQATWRDFATPLSLLPVPANGRVLDVGSGSGAVSRLIVERMEPRLVVGLDRDPAFTSAARCLAATRNVPRLVFAVGDARFLPFADGSFDLVWTSFVLEYLGADPLVPIRELARVTRPGGTVAAFDVDGFMLHHEPIESDLHQRIDAWHASVHSRGFDPEIGRKLPAIFRAAGLADVRWQTFPDPELYPIGRPPDAILVGWEQRLAGMRGLALALGSEAEAERFRQDFLALLRRPDRRTIGANWLVWGRPSP